MNNIKKLRLDRKITQTDLSKILGIKQSTIAMWETGESMPRASLLPELAKVLGCTIDDLFKKRNSDKEVG